MKTSRFWRVSEHGIAIYDGNAGLVAHVYRRDEAEEVCRLWNAAHDLVTDEQQELQALSALRRGAK